MVCVRESWKWLKCKRAGVTLVEIFPGLYNFPDSHAILVVSPSAYVFTNLGPKSKKHNKNSNNKIK